MRTGMVLSTLVCAAIIGVAMAESGEMMTTMDMMRHEMDAMKGQLKQIDHMQGQLKEMDQIKDSLREMQHDMALQKNDLAHLQTLVQKQDTELVHTRQELLNAQAIITATIGTTDTGERRLQADSDTTVSTNNSECLSPGDIAHQALNQTYSVNQAYLRFINENAIDAPHSYALPATFVRTSQLEGKADTSWLVSVEQNLNALTNEFRATGIADSVQERGTCVCATCADQPQGGCEPWQNFSTPCDCILDGPSTTAPFRQGWETVQDPPCCRPEWSQQVSASQISFEGQRVYSLDGVLPTTEVLLKVNGALTLNYSGYENVLETDCDEWRIIPGGIESDPPTEFGGSFQHAFSLPGAHCFKSYNAFGLRIKVTVVDCEYCEVVHGYNGSELRSLARALESHVAGNYTLHARNYATDGVMTYLNVYDGQTVTITGRGVGSDDQLTSIDAMIHVFDGATLILDAVHVSSHITRELRGTFIDLTGRVVPDHPGLVLPLSQDELPSCELGDRPAVVVWRRPELHQDVLMACTVMNGEANWREVQTMGGVTYDGGHIDSFLSALRSGLPGKFVLRLVGVGIQYVIDSLTVNPYQDVRIISVATMGSSLSIGDVSLAEAAKLMILGEGSMLAFQEPGAVNSTATISFEGRIDTADNSVIVISSDIATLLFQGAVKMSSGSQLLIDGEIGLLDFPGGLAIDTAGTVKIDGAHENSINLALGTLWYFIDSTTNQGTAEFRNAGLGLLGTQGVSFGTIDGVLPGELQVALNGLQPGGGGVITGVVSRFSNGTIHVPDLLSPSIGKVFTDDHIEELFRSVHDGGEAGLFGLQLTRPHTHVDIGRLHVSADQNVFVSFAADASCHFHGGIAVEDHGSLTVRGRFTALRFSNSTTVGNSAKLAIQLNTLLAGSTVTFADDVSVGESAEFSLSGAASEIAFADQLSAEANSFVSIDITASELTFMDAVSMNASTFVIEGTINSLGFSGELYVSPGSSMLVMSSTERSIKVTLGTPWLAIDQTYNRGSFTWHSVGLLNTDQSDFGVIDGELPGDLAVVLDANDPAGMGPQSGIVRLSEDGTVDMPDQLNAAMGQIFTGDNVDSFVARVNAGSSGLIGLQLGDDDLSVDIPAMRVSDGQDVRVFGNGVEMTMATMAMVEMRTGGQLTISGTVQLTDFSIVGMAWTAANNGTVRFAGGVTAVLPDGTAPVIDGTLPGVLVAELHGSTVVEVTSSETNSTVFSPADWSQVQCFDETAISEFAAAASAYDVALIVLLIYSRAQDLTLAELSVSVGQDVRIFSLDNETTLEFTEALSVATGGRLWLAGTMSLPSNVIVEHHGTLRVAGDIALSDTAVLGHGREPEALLGSRLQLDGEVTVSHEDGTTLVLSGELPGTVTATLAGETVGTIVRTETGVDTVTTGEGWLRTVVKIKAWGAGGGGGERTSNQGWGGAGGYAEAEYLAMIGDTLQVTVGFGGMKGNEGGGSPDGGFPNGGYAGEWSYAGGGGGGASFVRAYTVTTRDSTGVVLGAGGGGGGGGSQCNAGNGGGGGGTDNGNIGVGGYGSSSGDGSAGTHGAGRGGYNSQSRGQDQNGAGGNYGCSNGGGGAGGRASFKNVIDDTYRAVNAFDRNPVNTDDPHYSASYSGQGGNRQEHGTRGRVVLIVGGEATIFDDTYTSYSGSYSTSTINSQSHDFVVQ